MNQLSIFGFIAFLIIDKIHVEWLRMEKVIGDRISQRCDLTTFIGSFILAFLVLISIAGATQTTSTTDHNFSCTYYIGNDNHVYQLSWLGYKWDSKDITEHIGAQPAKSGSALTTTFIGIDPRVYYLGNDDHIYQLGWWEYIWHVGDVTRDAGVQPAKSGSALTSITFNKDFPHVYYFGSNDHAYELAWLGNRWGSRDITGDAGAQPAKSGSALCDRKNWRCQRRKSP